MPDDLDINEVVKYHKSHGKLVTITGVRPPARFGELTINKNQEVMEFKEKPNTNQGWINGGFFILSPDVIDTIEADSIAWEKEPLSLLAENKELVAFKHEGFWQPMDTMREKYLLNQLWESGQAPWKVWS